MSDRARGRAAVAAASAALGVGFDNPDLLAGALTHPSAASRAAGNKSRRPSRYQRLEFLGDRVLGLVIADRLIARFPAEAEGALARRYAALVSAPTLAKVARTIGLGDMLKLGPSEQAQNGAANPANLADACEALIGALYLDGGLDKAAAFIDREWAPLISGQQKPPRDPKTALQEWSQARGLGLPSYEVVTQTGPPHAPIFEVAVVVGGIESAVGRGRTKRLAERAAAGLMFARLTGVPEAPPAEHD